MPRYLASGIYRDTGRDFKNHDIEAPSEAEARALAADLGMIVRQIWLRPEPTESQTAPRHRPKIISHNPDYPLLQLCGIVCSVVGAVFLGMTAILLFISFIGLVNGDYGMTAFGVAFLISPAITGLVLGGAGQAMLALRDIARNSLRQVEQQERYMASESRPPER